MNEILRKIYALYPSIGAWAKTGEPGPLWTNAIAAKHAMSQYVGPQADSLFMTSQHVPMDDRAFLRTKEALIAMNAVVDAIYWRQPLKDGLFPEETDAPV